jgi:hypothetical protein
MKLLNTEFSPRRFYFLSLGSVSSASQTWSSITVINHDSNPYNTKIRVHLGPETGYSD